jgi:hypothetical protein
MFGHSMFNKNVKQNEVNDRRSETEANDEDVRQNRIYFIL